MDRLEQLSKQFFVYQERGYGTYLSADELLELCGLQHAEVERLQAIVDKLPKTADGVPVVPGMVVWKSNCEPTNVGMLLGTWVCQCYSTHEAAEAAGGGE